MPTPQDWHRTLYENERKPRFGLAETLERLAQDEVDTVELTGWTHVVPPLLAQSLENNTTLTELSLQACRLGNDGMLELGAALRGPPIRVLNLAGNGLTDAGAIHLARFLVNHRTLVDLNLDWNGIADDGTVALAQALPTVPTWKTWSLAGIVEGRGGGWRDSFLQSDQLAGICNLGDVGVMALAVALPESKLERLVLSRQHHISYQGIAALSQALRGSQSLRELELQRVPVDDSGAIALAESIPHCNLVTLDLTINTIADRGAIALASALASGSLKNVSLQQSAMGIAGLQAFAHAAAVNPTLETLGLYGHNAGRKGSPVVWQIKPWLTLNRTMRTVQENEKLYAPVLAKLAGLENPTRFFRFVRQSMCGRRLEAPATKHA